MIISRHVRIRFSIHPEDYFKIYFFFAIIKRREKSGAAMNYTPHASALEEPLIYGGERAIVPYAAGEGAEAGSAFGPAGAIIGAGLAVAGSEAYQHRDVLERAAHYAAQKVEEGLHQVAAYAKHFVRAKVQKLTRSGEKAPTKVVRVRGRKRKKAGSGGRKAVVKRPLPGGGHIEHTMKRPTHRPSHGAGNPLGLHKWTQAYPGMNQAAMQELQQKIDYWGQQAAQSAGKPGYADAMKHLMAEEKVQAAFGAGRRLTSIGYVEPRNRMWWSSGGRVRTYGMPAKQAYAVKKRYSSKRYRPKVKKWRPSKGARGARRRNRPPWARSRAGVSGGIYQGKDQKLYKNGHEVDMWGRRIKQWYNLADPVDARRFYESFDGPGY